MWQTLSWLSPEETPCTTRIQVEFLRFTDVAVSRSSPIHTEASCTAGAPLVVHGFSRIGAGSSRQLGYPAQFSHVLRNWLPRFQVCKTVFAPTCRRLWVPHSLQPIYREIVTNLAPGMDIVGFADETSSPQGAVTCMINLPEASHHDAPGAPTIQRSSYVRSFAEGLPFFEVFRGRWATAHEPTCRSADVVLILRGKGTERTANGGHSGASRRSVLNPEELWLTVRSTAASFGLTARRVEMESMPFAAQRAVVCTTRLVVAQHGSAIGHILWSRAPTRAVLELPPAIVGWWHEILLANDVYYGHAFQHSVSPPSRGDVPWNGHVQINATLLSVQLSAQLARVVGAYQGLPTRLRKEWCGLAYPTQGLQGAACPLRTKKSDTRSPQRNYRLSAREAKATRGSSGSPPERAICFATQAH